MPPGVFHCTRKVECLVAVSMMVRAPPVRRRIRVAFTPLGTFFWAKAGWLAMQTRASPQSKDRRVRTGSSSANSGTNESG